MRSIALLFALLTPSAQAFAQDSEKLKALEERLNKLEGAPAKTSLSAFNPAIGMALDFTYSHFEDKGNFNFRAAELNVEAPIDPHLKGWAIINGSEGGRHADDGASP